MKVHKLSGPPDPMQSWLSILILFALGAGFGAFNVAFRSPRPEVVTPKTGPHECGVPPDGDARERQSVKFYLVAMVFLLFDIEVAFSTPGQWRSDLG